MKEFFSNIKQEFKKITWPTNKEMKLSTTQVFVFVVALSLFFAAVDAVISTGVAAINGEDVVEEVNEDEYDLGDLLDDDYDVEDDSEDVVEEGNES